MLVVPASVIVGQVQKEFMGFSWDQLKTSIAKSSENWCRNTLWDPESPHQVVPCVMPYKLLILLRLLCSRDPGFLF